MNPSHEDDDVIDALLRRQFGGAVNDDGFADRVMRHLPARRRRRAWPSWSGLAAGAAACASSLSSTPMFRTGWRDWIVGEPSMAAIAMLAALAGLSLLAMCWSLSEADGA